MTLIDYFIKTGPCEVSKEKFDAAVANLESFRGRMSLMEFKQVENSDRLQAHLERIEQVEARYHNLYDKITKLELNAQAGFRDICSQVAKLEQNLQAEACHLYELTKELSLRIEQVSHRLEALKLKIEPEDQLDETDL